MVVKYQVEMYILLTPFRCRNCGVAAELVALLVDWRLVGPWLARGCPYIFACDPIIHPHPPKKSTNSLTFLSFIHQHHNPSPPLPPPKNIPKQKNTQSEQLTLTQHPSPFTTANDFTFCIADSTEYRLVAPQFFALSPRKRR
jgi:hypothetical protein